MQIDVMNEAMKASGKFPISENISDNKKASVDPLVSAIPHVSIVSSAIGKPDEPLAEKERKKFEDIIIGASLKEEQYKREIETLLGRLKPLESNKSATAPVTTTSKVIDVSIEKEEQYKREIETLLGRLKLLESNKSATAPVTTTSKVIDISIEKEEQYKHTISTLLANINSLENDKKQLLNASRNSVSNIEVVTEPTPPSNNGLNSTIKSMNIAKEFASLRAQKKKVQEENEKRIKEMETRIDIEVKSKVAEELNKLVKESANIWTQTDMIDSTTVSSSGKHSKEVMGHFSLEDEVSDAVGAMESMEETESSVEGNNASNNLTYGSMRRRSIYGANNSATIGLEKSIALPPGFHLVHVRNKELELCPGVILATTSYHGYNRKMLPKYVVYCYRSDNAAYLKGLKKLPTYVPAPKVANCEAVLIPPIFEVAEGIKLIHGASLGKTNSIELPPDILVIKIEKKGAILPSGLTTVEFSNIIKIPEAMIEIIPSGVIVVQMNTNVLLPVGVEVAPGCTIAETPEDLLLPDNVVLVTLEKGKVLPPFMTALSATPEEEIAITLNTSITSGCTVVKKPSGVMFGLGVEIIHRWHGHPMPSGMTPLPLCEHPKGLHLGGNYELVRLTPRFDFPTTCSPAPGWTFFAKPYGLRLPPNVHLIKYIDERGGGVLPNFMREVTMPDLPYDIRTKIPVSVVAADQWVQ